VEKRSGREAKEGLIEAYIHTGGKLGVLVDLNCETDFVARTDEFRALARDLRTRSACRGDQSPGGGPRGHSADMVEKREEIYRAQIEAEGRKSRPKSSRRSSAARWSKFYKRSLPLEQPFVRFPKKYKNR